MERQSSTFEYLCRVCAANTKGKNSVAECVYILKTPALKDKIEKYLYLTISDDDILPKVLCKTCFRQVEATASLSKIAKHTQKVFRDFIFNTKSYQQAESSSGENSTSTVTTTTAAAAAPPAPAPPPAYTPPTAAAATNYAPTMPAPTERPKRKEREKEKAQVINADASPPPPAPAPTALAPPSSTCTHKDEVIVNVSVNDPLTRETQHKMITASRHRQNSIDTRFTPKSIAQRGFTPKQTEGPSPGKKQTASSGVINFFPNRPQQVTTITSGGYVIGPTSTENNAANAITEIPTPPAVNHTNTQQKRRNLKTALSNLKPPNEGQVSLLKNSHKAGPTQQQQLSQLQPTAPSTKVIETAVPTLLVEDDVPVEPLPEKIIIAATKQQKHQAHATAPPPPPPQPSPPSEVVEVLDADFQQEPQTEPTDLSQPTKTNIPDDILLGKVIKDGDLLKLILKALKWPVNKHNMEDQLERLRNSRFANIMADPNLLQDADLTQIMGPYLGPVLQAAQMLQQQQIAAAAAAAALTKETELQVAGITNALPYKLPAETSVQLVPASPEAEEESAAEVATVKASASSQSQKRNAAKDGGKPAPAKKPRKSAARGRSASVFNNDEFAALNAALTSQYLNSKSTPDFNADLDPAALFAQLGMLSGLSASSSNEALLALLQRQRIALSRMNQPQQQQQQPPQPKSQPRRQRVNSIITIPASGSDFIFDTDDIILMEPDDGIVSTTTNSQNSTSENVVVLGNASTVAQSDANIIFTLPQQIPQPIITRPIIKRRKTVIQASPACMNLAINAQDLTSTTSSQQQQQAAHVLSNATPATATTRLASTSVTNLLPLTAVAAQAPLQNQLSKTQSLDSLNVIATQYPSNIISIGTQMPSNTTQASEAAVVCTSISTKATETTLTLTATAATSVTSLATTTNASTVSGAKAGRSTTTRSRSANTRRQPTSKAALGQQLLEAIGLQKVASETNKSVAAAPAAAAAAPAATPAASRGSVQQIRSALKKSLQKAQEHQQQQQRNKRTTSLTITEEIPNQNVNIVKEVVVQPRNKYTNNTPVGELDVEEEINKITLVLQSKSKDDKKVDEVTDRRASASPTKIPGIRRKLMPATRNRKSAIVLVADEIVDLVDDEDNQDAAEGKVIEKNKNNEKAKDVRAAITEKGDNEVQAKEANKNMKTVSPTRQRRRKLKPEEVQEMVDEEDDDYDEEDDKPLKPRTVKSVDNDKQEDESPNRAGTPRQRSRKTPANGRKAPSERDYDKESDDEASFKNDNESVTSSNVSTRPSRASKTNSRYYKGPDKSPSTPRRSTMSTRSSRAKN